MTGTQPHHPHDSHAGHGHQQHDATPDDYGDLLELDAAVLHDYWSAALTWVQEQAADAPRTRLLDLGTGTGTGALGLAQRFGEATVAAVDIMPESLARVRAKALDLGLADRVETVQANLDEGWPELGTLDLTWASMSLHHMADPGRVLREVLAVTRRGGLIAVAEFAEPLRFLPEDLGFGRPGLENRAAETLGRSHAEKLPSLGSAWAPRLTEAGWTVVAERDFPIDLNPSSHPLAPRYARAWFVRLSQGLDDQLEPGDRVTLAELLDDRGPRSLLHRTDLHIRGVRSITLARRD